MEGVIVRLLKWIVRRVGLRNLLLLALLGLALSSVVLGLAEVIRGLDTRQIWFVTVIGILVGWGLAATGLPGRGAGSLAALSGLGLVSIRIGRLGAKLAALLRALIGLCWSAGIQSIPCSWLPDDAPLNPLPAVVAVLDLWGDVSALLARVRDWVLALVAGERVFDPVAIALLWGLALWAASVWAGWMVRRRDQPLPALIPAGALLTITLAYAGSGSWALQVFLGATLLLLALVGYDVAVRRWEAAGVDFADPGPELVATVALLSLALVLAAVLSPSLSVQKLVEFARELGAGQTEESVEALAESLGVEQQPGESSGAAGGLPRYHVIRAGPRPSQRAVMIVSTGDLPPGLSEIMRRQRQPRYYWRAAAYDRYVHYGWLTGETGPSVSYEAGEPAITEILDTQRTVRQEVQVVGALGNALYVTGALVTADHDYQVAWRSPNDAFAATIDAAAYRADSVVPVVSEEGLRAAGTDYPEDWVRERYLALPDLIPERVLSLAYDLTATEPTPYDRARAIEAHLRTISYTLDVPAPPRERDVVDYFIFDLQKGYCDYYATSMVVLARMAGLPARYVTGYASGTYDATNARYVVVEADAHAWAEVYFPGYGWVEFEPTAGLPPIDRPAASPSLEWPEPEGELEPAVTRWESSSSRLFGVLGELWWLMLPGTLALLVLASVAWSAADGWWLQRLRPAKAATTLYGRLRRHGQRLAAPLRTGDTPYEFVASLAEHVAALAQGRRWGGALAPVDRDARLLAGLYVQVSYSPRALTGADHARLVQIWQRLRWRLWLARLLRGPRGIEAAVALLHRDSG